MNIVSSTPSAAPNIATPVASRPDRPTTGHAVPASGEGTDVGIQDDLQTMPAFDTMLSKHLGAALGDGTDVVPQRGRVARDAKLGLAGAGGDEATGVAPVDDAATAVDAGSGVGAVVPQGLFPTLAGATGRTTEGGTSDDVARRTRSTEDHRTTDGDAGSDLAAQLALASQWTQAAMPVDPTPGASNAPTATTIAATTGAGIDTRSPFGKERASPSEDDPAPAADGATPASGSATPPNPAARTTVTPIDTAVVASAGVLQNGVTVQSLPVRDPAARSKDGAATARAGATLVDTASLAKSAPSSHDPSSTDTLWRDARSAPVAAANEADAGTRRDLVIAATDGLQTVVTPGADTVGITDAFAQRLAIQASAATVAAGSSPAVTNTPTTTSAAPASFAYVQEPVGSIGWSREVGQATLRMAANDLQSASIRLNPEHLGPLDVQVRVDNGIAHVAFNATHVDTRQALEASRGVLDQLFTNQGLKMGDVSVGSGASGGAGTGSNDASATRGDASSDASRRDSANRWSGGDAGNDVDAPVATVTTRIARALGLVDTFA